MSRRSAGPTARRTVENTLRKLGFQRITGGDEVGRGCLAGPVVILEPLRRITGLRDLKLLTPHARARLHGEIISSCLGCAAATQEARYVDRLNVH